MKRIIFVILFATIVSKMTGQSSLISYPNSVELFGLCEISFRLPTTYSNPYNPDTINVYAEFTGPDNSTYTVNAFYYEGYTFQQHIEGYEVASRDASADGWRIRFTPNSVGTWSFIIRAFDKNGALNLPILNSTQTFSCTAVNDAEGFISMANSRFLKRDIVEHRERKFYSFFPIGPNVAWYNCQTYCATDKPLGIYYYEDHIDSLYNNANYMRIWINRYHRLSLYGPEYAPPENQTIYFDSLVNQKDAAELDHIFTYASQHDISIMLSIFNQGDFITNKDSCDPSEWTNNPFHSILGLSSPCDFFSDTEAIRITKNLIRYIVSRWGYATNVMCWELWNEVDKATGLCSRDELDGIGQDIVDWHDEMASYIRSIDPFGHCISSSIGDVNGIVPFSDFYQNLDIVQRHSYQHIQQARSKFEIPYSLYLRINSAHNDPSLGSKPFFMGEYGFTHRNSYHHTDKKDPHGVSLHNSLWSSLFSASIGPASLWWWSYLDSCGLYERFKPLINFCQRLPILSETFEANNTGELIGNVVVFPNNLQTYYMSNATEDTIMGWSQDSAFAYQSLRWLTDSVRTQDIVLPDTILPAFYFRDTIPPFDPAGYIYTLDSLKRPGPSSNSNLITLTITNQPVGSSYSLQWYNSETGMPYNTTLWGITVQQDSDGNKFISFQFPSFIRDLRKHTINNTFGDAVFILVKTSQGPSQKDRLRQ